MNFVRRISLSLAAVAALVAVPSLHAQVAAPTAVGGVYIPTDPLAGVRYDNKYDLSVGLAYAHIKAGPRLTQGANLGGFDISGSYWFSRRFALEGSGRDYIGTSGAQTNTDHVNGPYVTQQMYLGGVEYLGPHNKHADIILHALVGASHNDYDSDLPASTGSIPNYALYGFYKNQTGLAGAFGGHLDLNRSTHWVFRITPDALLTTYDPYGNGSHQQWQFGLSVGAEYKFARKRR